MLRDRFKMFQRFVYFNAENTGVDLVKTDKTAPIRDIVTKLNFNLKKYYTPSDCITLDERLFPYRDI